MLCGFGVGLSWATSIIEVDEKLIKNIVKRVKCIILLITRMNV